MDKQRASLRPIKLKHARGPLTLCRRKRRTSDSDVEALHAVKPTCIRQIGAEASEALLAAVTNQSTPAPNSAQATYLCYLTQKLSYVLSSNLAIVYQKVTSQRHVEIDTLARIAAEIALYMGAQEQFNIDSAIEHLADKGLIAKKCGGDMTSVRAARQLIFAILGWITMLYVPKLQPQVYPSDKNMPFNVETEGLSRFLTAAQPNEMAQRPFIELLLGFGNILPFGTGAFEGDINIFPTDFSDKSLHVSNLNASTLARIGKIKITWVECVSAHLDFDPAQGLLSLFCLPSFCVLHCSESTAITRLMTEYYQDWDCPFLARAFCQEVLLSYRLIFASESRARKNYHNSERQRAQRAAGGLLDPSLDQYCGLNTYGTPGAVALRVSYSHTTDFPIFGARLLAIQAHVLSQHPNRIKALWQDKRDLLRWYTLWAVIFIGIVGLLLAVLQIILSALQVAIAWRSYQIQIK